MTVATIPDDDTTNPSMAVIGAALLSHDTIPDIISTGVIRDDFEPREATIWDAITTAYREGHPTDPVTIAGRLGGGLHPHLRACMDTVPTAANGGWYAAQLHTAGLHRRLTEALNHAAGCLDIGQAISEAQEAVQAAVTGQAADSMVRVGEVAARIIPDPEQPRSPIRRVWTGIPSLDNQLGGLRGLVVIGARTSVGKSVLSRNIARHVAVERGKPVVFFSLEMNREEVATCFLADVANVPLQHITDASLSGDEYKRLHAAQAQLAQAPLWVDDNPSTTVAHVAAKTRLLNQRHTIGLVVVDYLQLMTSGKRVESRQQEVAGLSRDLKVLAQDLDCPVIAVSQINRGPEQRSNKRPMISDLRESGAVEQDADQIILIHREDMYDHQSPRVGEAVLDVAKNRHGKRGELTVAFRGTVSRFQEMP